MHIHNHIYQITLLINPLLCQDVKVGTRLNLFERCQVIQSSFPIYVLYTIIMMNVESVLHWHVLDFNLGSTHTCVYVYMCVKISIFSRR